jgi:hypothetical protein
LARALTLQKVFQAEKHAKESPHETFAVFFCFGCVKSLVAIDIATCAFFLAKTQKF